MRLVFSKGLLTGRITTYEFLWQEPPSACQTISHDEARRFSRKTPEMYPDGEYSEYRGAIK